MDALTEREIARQLYDILQRHKAQPHYKRLRVRLRDLGKNVSDERKQFLQLQKACRESEELARECREAGLGDIAMMNSLMPDAQVGRLVNGFNRMVEGHWEDW